MRWRRSRGWLVGLVVAGVAAAGTGWHVTDRLEQQNDFCNACHLEPGVALHREIRRDFDAVVPASLAAGHARAGNVDRPDGDFRCIDCHGGVGPVGRLRVKALAGRDAFWYVVGHFEEPRQMRWPLWDEDCSQCHETFDESEPDPWQSPRFHQLAVHNTELGVDCVACHLSHEGGANPEAYFIHAGPVREQCARCHAEFEEGGGS